MILQRLHQYYERKNEEGDIAPPGFEYREIAYLVIINEEGKFLRFESQYLDEKKKRSRVFLVPKSVERSSNENPNLLWDNAKYIIKDTKKQDLFYWKLEQFNPDLQDPTIVGLCNHYKVNSDGWGKDSLFSEICSAKMEPSLTFKVDKDSDILSMRENIFKSRLKNPYDFDEQFDKKEINIEQTCSITGEILPIAKIHPTITGVKETNQNRGNIVSFNKDKSAYDSFGKLQGYNAPISKKAAFAYTTALNTLLSADRHQRIYIGDTTIVFWSEKKNDLEEGGFLSVFNEPEYEKGKQQEAELQRLDSLKYIIESPKSGKSPLHTDTSGFYVLGLGPNSARISIRFWYEGDVGRTVQNLSTYFEDLRIVAPAYESGFLSLKRLVKSTAVREDDKNILPELTLRLFQAILKGESFPRIVLERTISRIKADHSDFAERNLFPRISLIKAYLNRRARFEQNPGFQEVSVEMDETNTNTGYNLGRFFAVLERAQEVANPGINTTIRDRYFSSACSRPGTVFPVLVNLGMHHVAKAGGGLEVYFEKLKGEIMTNINKFPLTLKLEDQGQFAIGYYHQRQEFFKKKEGANQ